MATFQFKGLDAYIKQLSALNAGDKGDIIGKGAGALKVSKDEGEIDAITASTITSRSFLRAVNNAAAIYSTAIGRQLKVDLDTQSGASQQQANNKHK